MYYVIYIAKTAIFPKKTNFSEIPKFFRFFSNLKKWFSLNYSNNFIISNKFPYCRKKETILSYILYVIYYEHKIYYI